MSEVLFVPYALRKQDDYAATARKAFQGWGFKLTSIHETESPVEAARSAQVLVLTLSRTLTLICSNQAIFIGGGNTFQLLNNLYENKLIDVIRKSVQTFVL